MHQNHKIIELSDIEKLKKENIIIDSSIIKFNNYVEFTKSLKIDIEKEIDKINNLYEKTVEEITKSFIAKHEELIFRENNIKEKLQLEVTNVKKNLENYLLKSNNEIKLSENINRGIKKLQSEENNILKNIAYASKLNKSIKEMKKLSNDSIKSLKFKYHEDKCNIKYEDYIFKENHIPKILEIKDINSTSCKVFWGIDNNEKNNNKKIQFKVEIKSKNEDFYTIYEGENEECSIDNLLANTNYELRVGFLNKFLDISWSEIKKIKISDFDSTILKRTQRESEFVNKLIEWSGYKKMDLIYRGTRDGMNRSVFHSKCNNKGETLSLFENDQGNIFGGYASIPWESKGGYQNASNSFIFSLTNIYNLEPIKFPSVNLGTEICDSSSYGPCFGNGKDIGIFVNGNNYSGFPKDYQDTSGKGKSIFTGYFNNNIKDLKIKEIEVFQLLK